MSHNKTRALSALLLLSALSTPCAVYAHGYTHADISLLSERYAVTAAYDAPAYDSLAVNCAADTSGDDVAIANNEAPRDIQRAIERDNGVGGEKEHKQDDVFTAQRLKTVGAIAAGIVVAFLAMRHIFFKRGK